MNNYLTREIWKMRKPLRGGKVGIPLVSIIKVENQTYQLLFSSVGCSNACVFCNYGFDFPLSLEKVKPELEKITIPKNIFELEIEANGSFLSEREIPFELFLETLKFVAHRGIPLITMETHYKDITERKIQIIREILGNDQVVSLELGFESANPKIRKYYNKDIDNKEFIEVANMCSKYGIEIQVNVLLGAPFLDRAQQIQDCIQTLEFIFNNLPKGTFAVLFPINIKTNTMLYQWQKKGIYKQISAWELVELLHRMPEKYLQQVSIAWWGNRENAYQAGKIQHPTTCENCKKELMEFFATFYSKFNGRKELVEKMWLNRCFCYT